MEEDRLKRVLLLEALQVKLKKDLDADDLAEVQSFTWDVLGFDQNYIMLQINIQNPEAVSFHSRDFIEVTFYGVEFFKSFQGVEVEFGTQLHWRIVRQISKQQAQTVDKINDAVFGVFATISIAMLLFVGLGGRLLPTWMFLNSMQLIVHTPLFNTAMPANLHYFFKKYLNMVRLNVKSFNEALEERERESGLENYALASNPEGLYTPLLNECGYKHVFSRNLIVVLFFGVIFCVIACGLASYDFFMTRRLPKQKAHRRFAHAAWMSNFTLRYVYEVFFEVFLCMLIHTTTVDHKDNFL